MLNPARSFMVRQTPASVLVVLTGAYAMALSLIELVAAVDFRILTGTMLHAGLTTDPLFGPAPRSASTRPCSLC